MADIIIVMIDNNTMSCIPCKAQGLQAELSEGNIIVYCTC